MAPSPDSSLTPMMRQYHEIKQQYPDCLLLFRLGDFYELFLEDAKIGAKVLNITLTSRDEKTPMAGVPYHALDAYLPKLVRAGHKVAICEQTSEPGKSKIVEREVVRIVTPATILSENNLADKQNNFLLALQFASTQSSNSKKKNQFGLAWCDLTTGEFKATTVESESAVQEEITRLQPSEILISQADYENKELLKILKKLHFLFISPRQNWLNSTEEAHQNLKLHFGLASLRGFGFTPSSKSLVAAWAIIDYLKETQKSSLAHITSLQSYYPSQGLVIDQSTTLNLEIFSAVHQNNEHGSLIENLDWTVTPMGGRLLRDWLRKPINNQMELEKRYQVVQYFLDNNRLRQQIQELLDQTADVERLVARLSLGQGNPLLLLQLQRSLDVYNQVKTTLADQAASKSSSRSSLLTAICQNIDEQLSTVSELIATTINFQASADPRSGHTIARGVDPKLDELHHLVDDAQDWISEFEQQQRQLTGIPSLKVRSNKVFGYYIEITNTHQDKVPNYYERKQTLVNCERFITPDLKKYEHRLLTANEKLIELEYQLFCETVDQVLQFTPIIQQAAAAVAKLDTLMCLAQLAEKNHYCQPQLNSNGVLDIKAGRHPVVEQILEQNEFVPNDIYLDNQEHQLLVITGPNMAGKSVLMRQVALIVLLAHIGSFVPASQANISLTDRIFVRSGAADMIAAGLSTFMVEMVETANILNHATSQSLIIMDEIGRGTSTYDGLSLAWAIAEHLVTTPSLKAKTLFATHYHELQNLAKVFPHSIKNIHLAIEDYEGQPVFLYQIKAGGASQSYGLEVAGLAGITDEVVARARYHFQKLKQNKSNSPDGEKSVKSLAWLEKLQKLDLEKLPALEALNLLVELQQELNS